MLVATERPILLLMHEQLMHVADLFCCFLVELWYMLGQVQQDVVIACCTAGNGSVRVLRAMLVTLHGNALFDTVQVSLCWFRARHRSITGKSHDRNGRQL